MDIQYNLIPVNPFSRPGKKLPRVKALVIHWVANPGSTAPQNRHYFASLKDQSLNHASARYASAHFIVGMLGEIVQCIPVHEMAYHVGAKTYLPYALERLGQYPNNCCVGIELCHPHAEGRFTPETLTAATELCGMLCIQLGLNPLTALWRHYDITGKECPRWFVTHPEAFEEFKYGAQEVARKIWQ
jgi:N-acetylmuramoyl-L-alanine amidase